MAKTIQAIRSVIEAHAAAATPGSQTEAVWNTLHDLLDIQGDRPTESNQIDELQKKIVGLNQTINWQAGILQQIKTAAGAPDSITMTQLPDFIKGLTK